jgi:hypothetical protein
MIYSAFTGCSYTEGIGLKNTTTDKDLWVNNVHSTLLKHTDLLNLGKSGATNAEIFQTAIDTVVTYPCQYLFVQWTELLRYKLNPGVETYPTSIFCSTNNTQEFGVDINPGVRYSPAYIENIKNRFFDLHHEHYEIIKVIEYSNIIKKLCNRTGTIVFFINGILPWDENYFDYITDLHRIPSDTTLYTQKQLNADTRDDVEYFLLYDKIHKQYAPLEYSKSSWVNLYSGFRSCFYLDIGLDDVHPGVGSHQQFSNHLIENLQELLTT